MANMYRSVLSGGGGSPTGNAQPSEVLDGKTFENSNGPQTGSMTNNGAVSGVAKPDQPYTIPEGYHNGSGTVTAEDVVNSILESECIAIATVAANATSITLTAADNIEDGNYILASCGTSVYQVGDKLIDKATANIVTYSFLINIDSGVVTNCENGQTRSTTFTVASNVLSSSNLPSSSATRYMALMKI